MRLVVFGANGPTGRLVVRQATRAGHHVAAVTRRPADYPLTGPLVQPVGADVTDPAAVAAAIGAGCDAVVSTYGVPYGRRPITVYSEGMTHICAAMAAAGVDRLVCVTSTTVAAEEAPGMSLAWRKAIEPVLRRVLGRTLYDDMERMEAVVRGSDLDWTIVRPAGLYDAEEPSGDYTVSTGRQAGHHTSRADLAELLLTEATGPGHPRAVVEVISGSGPPHPLRTVLREVGVPGLGDRSPAR